MPLDRDEDASDPLDLARPNLPAARPPSRAPARAPTPSNPAAPKPLRWGVCGVFHEAGGLGAYPGDRGIVRFVAGGVQYTPPPFAPVWRPAADEPARYDLPWPGNPAAARTLAGLRSALEGVPSAALAATDHPLRGEAAAAILALVELAAGLEKAGWSLGLMQPSNVVLCDGRAVPIDLGFTWRGAIGSPPWDDAPGRPAWVEAEQPFAWLWDTPPVRQQFAAPVGSPFPPTAPNSSAALVGRLAAWLVTGRAATHGAIERPPGASAAAWAVVADAATGRVGTAAELLSLFRQHSPADLFPSAQLPPVHTSGGVRRVALAASALVALTAVAGGIYWAYKSGPPARPPETDAAQKTDRPEAKQATVTPAPTPIPPTKADERAGDPLLNELAALAARARAVPPDRRGELDGDRAAALDRWVAAVAAVRATLAPDKVIADPALRLAAAAKLTTLRDALRTLADAPAAAESQRNKENQCLAFVTALADQLTSR